MAISYRWPVVARRAVVIAGGSLLALGPVGLLPPTPTRAIQYSDGTVGFSHPPRLSDSFTTRNLVFDGNATYYLTFAFPAEATEPMERVEVRLETGFDPLFRFNRDRTEAFATVDNQRRPLGLGEITEDRDTQILTIPFDPPLEPGVSVTLALRPRQNPRFAGVYLFGLTAYPVGEAVRPTFMGYGRLSFYERDSRRRWP